MTSRLPNLLGGAALLAAFAFGFANVATAQTITVSGCTSFTTAGGTSANITITCNTGTGGGGVTPPSCSGANIATVGTTLTFSASCSQGTNPITSVTINGVSLCAGAACTSPFPVNIPGLAVPASTTNYTVTASDGSLQGSSTATYVVAGGGGGAFDLSGCTAAGYIGRGLDVAYPVGASNTSITNGANKASPGGSFGNNDALVVRFTTPAAGVNDQTVFQPAGNTGSQNTGRVYTLSTQPCQFATSPTPTGSILYATSSQSPAITVNVKACPYTGAYAGYCNMAAWLQPNTTYYVTMVNRTTFGGLPSCAVGNCDMRIDFNK